MSMLGLGEEIVVRLPASVADAVPGTWTPPVQGPSLPPGYTPQPFNCPEGSDFGASQQAGMCVASDYSPVYSQTGAAGRRTYYNLDGSVAGYDTPPTPPLIRGVPNMYLYLGAGLLVLLMFGRRR